VSYLDQRVYGYTRY